MVRVPARARPLGPLLCAALIASACADPRPYGPAVPECERCHGGGGSPAPPASVLGYRGTGDRPVGAHRRHLEPHPGAVRAPIACDECHVVPEHRFAPGHIDGAHATVTFGPLARAGLAEPSWDREALTCTATYCHGTTLDAGGTNTAPVWTAVDEGQAACGTCHGNPPPAPHPASAACAGCHPATVLADGTIDLLGGQHIDGELDVGALGCSSCHGSPQNPAPPVSTTGGSATFLVAVGAHQAHLRDGAIRLAVGCASCHAVPSSTAHADGTVSLAWSPLAGSVTWDRTAATCATYCHGATLGAGGSNTRPVWTSVGTGQTACGTCHGSPPPPPHPASTACAGCHPATVRADGAIDVAGGQHIDGELDVTALGCSSCHGSAQNPAPPVSTTGESATAAIAVGAHQAHLRDGAIRLAVGCTSCHAIPTTTTHADGTVNLAWSALAGTVTWDRAAATCSTYCHGATLGAGGSNTLPVWTSVGTGQTACGTCHGNPPPAPHPASTACAGCHPATVRADGAIDVAGGQHIDGGLDASVACGSCHGAPPATGAHLAHGAFATPSATAYGDLRILEDYAPEGGSAYRFGCGHCHPLDPARHMDAAVQVDLSREAPATGLRARNADGAAYAGGVCNGVYCHSSGQLTPAYVATPAWTGPPGALGCGGCHGNPPQYPSGGAGTATANSHLDLAEDGWEFGHVLGMPGLTHPGSTQHGVDPAGGVDAAPITCQTCHYATTDPAAAGPSGFYWLDTTGSYVIPGGLGGFECGWCHGSGGAATGEGKVLPLRHVNGSREVVFDPREALPAIPWLPGAPNTPAAPYWLTDAGSYMPYPAWVTWNGTTASFGLGTATYDPVEKRCSNIACHLVEQPVWGTPYVYTGWATCVACHPFF